MEYCPIGEESNNSIVNEPIVSNNNTFLHNVGQGGLQKGIEKKMLDLNLEHISRLDIPLQLDPETATFEDIVIWAMYRGKPRLSRGTVTRNLRYLRFMEAHPVVPIDFRKLKNLDAYRNFIRHMDYREVYEFNNCKDGSGTGALRHEWQAMKMVLQAYGIPYGRGQLWDYSPPSRPDYIFRKLPSPDEIHALLQYDKYSKDAYTNQLIKYSLAHSFVIGWRVPSEPCAISVNNIDFSSGIITVVEPKKHRSTRPHVLLNEAMMYSRYRMSFKNWVDIWRPKAENQHSKDALYLRPNGKPITDDQYRKFLSDHVKPVHQLIRKNMNLPPAVDELYYPNMPRHWVATGLLVKEYIKTRGIWNSDKVRRHIGHTKEGALKHYIRDAEQYIRLYPYDWFKRILKNHNKNGWGIYGRNQYTPRNRAYWKNSLLLRTAPSAGCGPLIWRNFFQYSLNCLLYWKYSISLSLFFFSNIRATINNILELPSHSMVALFIPIIYSDWMGEIQLLEVFWSYPPSNNILPSTLLLQYYSLQAVRDFFNINPNFSPSLLFWSLTVPPITDFYKLVNVKVNNRGVVVY